MKNNRLVEPYLDQDSSIFLFWKARIGLYLILKALGIGPGDEVILPGYTCVVVANAILYLGARPIYADIDPATYTISLETIQPLVTPHTRVIIAQNTFGLLSCNIYIKALNMIFFIHKTKWLTLTFYTNNKVAALFYFFQFVYLRLVRIKTAAGQKYH